MLNLNKVLILAAEYDFDFSWIGETWPVFLRGTRLTLFILVATAFFAILLGLIAGQMLTSKRRFVRIPARLYVDFFRLTPILVQIVMFFFLLPILLDVRTSALVSGIVALSFNYGAFFAEIFRAGVTSIDRGQTEAAQAMGMNWWKVLTRVIYPQGIRRMLPPLGSMLIGLTKDTSLVSVIGVAELFNTAQNVGAGTFRQIEVLLFISLIYLTINVPLSWAAERMHNRVVANA